LQRNFMALAPNQIWLADLTYIPTGEGWLYLAAILDMHTRKIVGWCMRDTLHVEIALEALTMAVQRQRPPPGLLHHSDRGIQYAAEAYRSALSASHITPSMSRKGNCWTMPPWRASSTPSKPNASTIGSTPHGTMPAGTCSHISKASITHVDCIPRWAISAPPKWNEKQLNPIHFFRGKS
jgi:hypothetical protein